MCVCMYVTTYNCVFCVMTDQPFPPFKQNSIRSPGPVVPKDVHCEGFDLTYTRIANDEMSSSGRATTSTNSAVTIVETNKNFMDKKVDDSIEIFLRSLTQIGPELLNVSVSIIHG